MTGTTCVQSVDIGIVFPAYELVSVAGVKFKSKIRSAHLAGFVVYPVVQVLLSVTESYRLARGAGLIQLFCGCRCEADKPNNSRFTAQSSGDVQTITLDRSSCSKGASRRVIKKLFQCRTADDQRREPLTKPSVEFW